MNIKTVLTLTALISLSTAQFFLKKDHKHSQYNSSPSLNPQYEEEKNGRSYKIVHIEPKKENFICPDQREACGMDHRTYKDRCSMPQGVEVFKMGRCPYNSESHIRKIKKRDDVLFYENYEDGYRTEYIDEENGERYDDYDY